MPWTTLTLTTTTPVFNGPDGVLRVSSLRGALRYWFRALVGTRIGNDPEALGELEEAVFGGTTAQSRVQFRLPKAPDPVQRSKSSPRPETWRSKPWVGYLLGQGHTQHNNGGNDMTPTPPGREFSLKIRWAHSARSGRTAEDEAINSLVMSSLWLLCTFGGIGARTRRGFGGLRITDSDGALPGLWSEGERARTPGLEFYQQLEHLGLCAESGSPAVARPYTEALRESLEHAATLTPKAQADRADPTRRPWYPVLSPEYTAAGISAYQHETWEGLAEHVGRQYRLARATRSNRKSETRYEPKVKTPEYIALTEGTSQPPFRLGAFGLPVNFKDPYSVNAETAQNAPLRRASPLWFRFVSNVEGTQWRLFSFAFHNSYFSGEQEGGNGPRVVARKGSTQHGPKRTVPDTEVEKHTRDWITRMANHEAPFPDASATEESNT
ncbi:type III-B CRISPR module RAMP protein Cmr1 [Lipingzhangella sp. LS1_29]|uniref:Type III-B CRISPR module RAMP protein Cmr1 n=1 Tax=Lipingzhangella rawalii TaxID=2055835 RepID=A0ABU2H330_9ACTN|nr:type III-B CRISPR module RAMP protein Cmr1 [Lipingzhangella rawalii]MDS1269713.1 type III-B CRISPR module RAMP protein Cmr1 [Lipingzhangella rawalii]